MNAKDKIHEDMTESLRIVLWERPPNQISQKVDRKRKLHQDRTVNLRTVLKERPPSQIKVRKWIANANFTKI